jgi:hypothetical protein
MVVLLIDLGSHLNNHWLALADGTPAVDVEFLAVPGMRPINMNRRHVS